MLPQHGLFVGCEIYAVCFNTSLPPVVETFVWLVINEHSDINGSAEVASVVLTYVSAMENVQPRRERIMWDACEGLPATQTFTGNVVHFQWICSEVSRLSEIERPMTEVSRSDKWGLLYGLNVEPLQAMECRWLGVTMKKSLSSHSPGRMGIYTSMQLGRGGVVGYYYESLGYENLTRLQHTTKTYKEEFMQVI